MIRAGRGGVRPVQEPLSEPTWPSRPIFGPKRRPRGFPGRVWSAFGASGRPRKLKNTVKYDVFAVFHVAPQTTPRSSKSALGGGGKMTPKRRPGAARDAPGGPQDGHKSATSVPRAPPRLRSGLGGQVGPSWHKRAARRPPGGHFGPPAGRFCTLRGPIFAQFSSLGKHRQSCPMGKACASIPLYLLVSLLHVD